MKGSFEMMAQAGFSEACDRNKGFILEVLMRELAECATVLEVGSGTGQHAVHFARNLPGLKWQPSDTGDYLVGLRARLAAEGPENIETPLELDVRMSPWPASGADGIFSANVLHYMSWECVTAFFRGVGEALSATGVVCIYGPFRYAGEFTSESNARFDQFLRTQDPDRGIRDFEAVDELAQAQNLKLTRDIPMPANNQLLVWRR
jgi:cyclopropane fatty-acyl-phospholipid synthase-like methyltransferase